jgi:hypothetical protein
MKTTKSGTARSLNDSELDEVQGGQQVAMIHLAGEMPVRITSKGDLFESNNATTSVQVHASRQGDEIVIRQS